MRNEMEAILKEAFRELALKTRYERGLTQSKMSRALVMSERSYEDIERGKTGCGALTGDGQGTVLDGQGTNSGFGSSIGNILSGGYAKLKQCFM